MPSPEMEHISFHNPFPFTIHWPEFAIWPTTTQYAIKHNATMCPDGRWSRNSQEKHAWLLQSFCTCCQHCPECSSPRTSDGSLSLHSNFAEIFRSCLKALSKTDLLQHCFILSFTYFYLKLYFYLLLVLCTQTHIIFNM